MASNIDCISIARSVAVFQNSKSLRIQLLLVLLPLSGIQLSQALVPQNFELLVGLLELRIHVTLIELVALGDGVLLVRLVPLSVPPDRVQLARVARIVRLVVLTGASLHNRMLWVLEILARRLHIFFFYIFLKIITTERLIKQ